LLKPDPINTKNWFAESPILCINSANMATFPVIKKVMPFIIAITAFIIPAHKADLLPFFNNPSNSLMSFSFDLMLFYLGCQFRREKYVLRVIFLCPNHDADRACYNIMGLSHLFEIGGLTCVRFLKKIKKRR